MTTPATQSTPRQHSQVYLLLRSLTPYLLASLALLLILYFFFSPHRQRNAFLNKFVQRGGYISRSPQTPLDHAWINAVEFITRNDEYRFSSKVGTVTSLSGAKILPDEIPLLALLPDLTLLTVKETPVTPEFCHQLRNLSKLTSLSIQEAAVTDAEFRHLCAVLPKASLTDLYFDDLHISPQAAAELLEFTSLTSLALDGSHLEGSILKRLAPLPLHRLVLTRFKPTDEDVRTIARQWSGSISSLCLFKSSLTDAQFSSLNTLTRLNYLDLNEVPITDGIALQISKFPQLKNLSLISTTLTGDQLRLISTLPLRYLCLFRTKLDDRTARLFTQIPTLENLMLSDNPLTDAAFPENHKFASLQNLRLDGTLISDQTIANIRNCPSLISLSLYQTAITDTSLKLLHNLDNCPRLTYLVIRKTKATSPAVKALQRARPKLQIISDLSY